MEMVISWSFGVEYFEVGVLFVLVNGEVEVLLGDYFFVDAVDKILFFLLLELLFEIQVVQFLFQQLPDFLLDVLKMLVVSFMWLAQAFEYPFLLIRISELSKPFSFGCLCLQLFIYLCFGSHLVWLEVFSIETILHFLVFLLKLGLSIDQSCHCAKLPLREARSHFLEERSIIERRLQEHIATLIIIKSI